jgi:PAS domain S-box-containing protein
MLQIIILVVLTLLLLAALAFWLRASRTPVSSRPRESLDTLSVLEQTTALAREKVQLQHDLERHRQIEEALRHSEERYRVLVEHANDVIIIAQDGVMKFANQRTESLLGYTHDELTNMPFTDLIAPSDRELVLDRYRRRLRGEPVPNRYTFRVQHRQGQTLWVEINTVPVDWEGRAATLSFLRDVTDQVQAEERIREAQRAAEAANQAKSRFLASMSHELRTPMNGVIGLTELALSTRLSDEQRRYLEGVLESGEFMLSLINTILDFSKIEAGKLALTPVEFRLRGELSDTVKVVAMRAAEKGLELACDVKPNVPDYLIGDSARLRQVLLNLVGNAVKFTEQGEVVLLVELVDRKDDLVTLRFAVRDTGIGIPVEKQQLIFEPFAQGDESVTRQYGGTGLGLAICNQLISMMGGELTVESRPAQGSAFVFTIRLRVPQQEARIVIPSAIQGTKILVVEGHAATREAVRDMALAWNLRPTVTGSVAEAAKLVDEHHQRDDPFGLLILDDALDHETNGRFSRRLVTLSPTTRLILITGHVHPEQSGGATAGYSSAHARVARPVMPSDLLEAIQDVADQQPRRAADAVEPMIVVQPSTHPLRILLVEDNLINQRVATSWLEKRGHAVVLSVSGEAALAELERHSIDVVLMDLEMPGAGGIATTAEIRRREHDTGQHLPIIAMTAHALEGDRERCLAAGMDDYLAKPIRPAELFHVVEQFAPRYVSRRMPIHESQEVVAGASAANGQMFDRREALATVGNDAQLLGELIEIFLADSPKWLRDLQAALDQGKPEDARRLAHSLKNSAGYFGANQIKQLAYEIEQAAAQRQLAVAQEKCERVLRELERLGPELARCREELTAPAP